jgi:hypothetical protein
MKLRLPVPWKVGVNWTSRFSATLLDLAGDRS